MTGVRLLVLLIVSLMLAVPVSAPAQSAPSPFTIVAVVNDDAITHYDVRERVKFVMATTGIKEGPETIKQLYPRILDTLIEEQLQLQAAEQADITINEQQIAQMIRQIEQNNQREKGSFVTFLKESDIDPATLRRQLRAQIAWSQVLSRKLRPRLQMSPAEMDAAIERLHNRERRVKEVKIASLSLPLDDKPEKTRAFARQMVDELREGAEFSAIASQLSSTSQPIVKPRWVPLRELPGPLASQLQEKQAPAIIGPIEREASLQILSLLDRREVDYRMNTEATFKDILLALPEDATADEADLLMDIAKRIREHPGPCGSPNVGSAKELDDLDFSVDYTRVRLPDISPEILPMARGLSVGETSEPFATPQGVRLLKLCEKVGLPISEEKRETLKKRVREEKYRLEAMRYLRNLRRDAFIDKRI